MRAGDLVCVRDDYNAPHSHRLRGLYGIVISTYSGPHFPIEVAFADGSWCWCFSEDELDLVIE